MLGYFIKGRGDPALKALDRILWASGGSILDIEFFGRDADFLTHHDLYLRELLARAIAYENVDQPVRLVWNYSFTINACAQYLGRLEFPSEIRNLHLISINFGSLNLLRTF
jgi:hypothetical protein